MGHLIIEFCRLLEIWVDTWRWFSRAWIYHSAGSILLGTCCWSIETLSSSLVKNFIGDVLSKNPINRIASTVRTNIRLIFCQWILIIFEGHNVHGSWLHVGTLSNGWGWISPILILIVIWATSAQKSLKERFLRNAWGNWAQHFHPCGAIFSTIIWDASLQVGIYHK